MQTLVKALAWSLIHSLWIGMAAALIAAMIISVTRRTKAKLRYNFLGLVYMLFLFGVSVTFVIYYQPPASSLAVPNELNGTAASFVKLTPVSASGGVLNDMTVWFNGNANMLLLIWCFFFFVHCLKLVTGLASVNRLRSYKTTPVSDEWKVKLERLKNSLAIKRSVKLLQSGLVKVPVALGFLKPVILLPVGLLASIPPEQVEAILLHELGHIRRKDYVVNLLQHFTDAVFFFNPAILWVSSLLRQEREACCDDIVVAQTGEKRNYLNALVSFQEYSLAHNSYAMGMSSRKNYLLNRVRRILTNENKKLNLFEKAALLGGMILFSAFTYISKEKESSKIPESMAAVTKINLAGSGEAFLERIPVKTTGSVIIIEKISANSNSNSLTDTVPVKKTRETRKGTGDIRAKAPVKEIKDKGKDAESVLADIAEIKKKIGVKKESIGEKKEQLKAVEGKSAEKEKAIKAAIEKERDEIEDQREELEEKRAILESLKTKNEKQVARDKEIENEKKKRKEDLKKINKGKGNINDKGDGKGNGDSNDKDGIGNGNGNDKGDSKGNGKEEGSGNDKNAISIKKVTPTAVTVKEYDFVSADIRRTKLHSFNTELRNKLLNSRKDKRFFQKPRTQIGSKQTQPPGVKEKPNSPTTPKVKTPSVRQI